jgi:hypothetical protein
MFHLPMLVNGDVFFELTTHFKGRLDSYRLGDALPEGMDHQHGTKRLTYRRFYRPRITER